MRDQLFEELAKLYGIEIQHDEQENGGLYYVDSSDITKKIDTVFDEGFFISCKETISVEQCFTFDTFNIIETNIFQAA